MKENISPEEKLLKLIKEDKKPRLKPAIKNPLFSFPRKLNPLFSQKLVVAFLVIALIYLFISFLYPWISLKKIKLPEVALKEIKVEEPAAIAKEEVKPYEFYQEALSQRQIFSQSFSQESAGSPVVADADLIKDINLVGVILGENPQAVLEDKKTQKTYYLNKGQFIAELQIEDIQEGKIILNYNGKRYELYL